MGASNLKSEKKKKKKKKTGDLKISKNLENT
jgi:hypothetical protein